MNSKSTMQDVAKASGYSRAAVSLALRGDRTIPEKTRAYIQQVARKLGYRTNPMVSALMSMQRQRRSTLSTTTAIAYLSRHAPDDPWRARWYYVSMFDGAAQRAKEIGCRLEEFSLTAPGMKPARVREILRTRGIHAVIVAPLPYDETRINFDFSGMAVVGMGMSVKAPVIERVSSDHFQSAALAVRHCVAAGYRRIGFVLSEETSSRLGHRWLGGFRFAIAHEGLEQCPPPLMTAHTAELPAAMPAWLKRYRPDVVLLGNVEPEVQAAVPLTVGLVSLGVDGPHSALTGIYQNWPLLGRVTAEHVIAKLYTNNFDPLEEGLLHLVEGTWIEGVTAPGPRQRRPALADLAGVARRGD